MLIDDATGKLLGLLFAEQESFHAYAAVVRPYFERYGKPVAFYSDKHGIFRVNQASRQQGKAQTQFGRAMKELDIQILCANSPQAKGRVERVIQTLQDRLVKELRLRHISQMADGNAYLPQSSQTSIAASPCPRSPDDAHRPLLKTERLETILAWQEPRILSKNSTLQFKQVVDQFQTRRPSYALRQARVIVCEDGAGAITLLYKSKPLAYCVFHKQQHLAQVVDLKSVDRQLVAPRPAHTPAPDHPWRQGRFPKKGTSQSWNSGDISTLG